MVGIIGYSYKGYSKTSDTIKVKFCVTMFLISLILAFYNFVISVIAIQIGNILLNILLQFLGIFLISLFVIDIMQNQNILGIKYGFKTLFDNILFFLKIGVFAFITIIILMILFGIILSSLPNEYKIQMPFLIGIIVKIISAYIIIIFVTEKGKEKNIYNE
jgi:hypothetical protein